MNRTQRYHDRPSFALFLAPDNGGGTGGSGGKTLEEQLTAAQTDLAAATAAQSALTTERDTAQTSLASAQAEVARLTAQFAALTTTAQEAQSALATAQSQVTSLTAERDTARNEAATSLTNVSRLEALCGVRGVDPSSAVAVSTQASDGQGAALYKQWQDLRKTDTAKAQSFYREHRAALDAYGDSQRG